MVLVRKSLLSLFFLSIVGMSNGYVTEVDIPEWYFTPEWQSNMDHLTACINEFCDSFMQDTNIYQDWLSRLSILFTQFDQIEHDCEMFFLYLRGKFYYLQNKLSHCEYTLSQKDVIITELQNEIQTIRSQMQQEVDRLNDIIAELNCELEHCRQSYATLLNLNDEQIKQFMNALCLLKEKYVHMVQARTAFLTTLDSFVDRVYAHHDYQREKTEQFMQEIC